MGIGNLAGKATYATAYALWQSGDRDKQNTALLMLSGLVAKSGSIPAIEMLQELTNNGVSGASGYLLAGLTGQAKKAAKNHDKGLAEGLVVLHNNGWDEATNAIRVVLPKRRAAKGSQKHIDVIRLFADAGFPPAIAFFNGDEDAIDFEVVEINGELPAETSTSKVIDVETSDLPPRLKMLQLAIEGTGAKCLAEKDTSTDEIFLLVTLEEDKPVVGGRSVRIYSNESVINMVFCMAAVDPEGGTEDEGTKWILAAIANTMNSNNLDPGDSASATNFNGEIQLVLMRKQAFDDPVDTRTFINSYNEFVERAATADVIADKLIEAFNEMQA